MQVAAPAVTKHEREKPTCAVLHWQLLPSGTQSFFVLTVWQVFPTGQQPRCPVTPVQPSITELTSQDWAQNVSGSVPTLTHSSPGTRQSPLVVQGRHWEVTAFSQICGVPGGVR